MCCLLRFPGLVYKYTTSLHSLSTSLPSNKTFKFPLTPCNPFFFFFSKAQKMAMILDAFMSKCCTLLTDYVQEEVATLLGVKEELKKLLQRMRSIQSLLKDAEKRKFDESSIDLWLSDLKDFMYDAEDMIDLCRIEGAQLLADQNPKSEASPICCNFSPAFSCFTSVPLRHEIGNRIKELNDRLNQIYQNRKQFKLEKSTSLKTPQLTLVDSRQTSSMVDPLVVGREVEDAANRLVDRLVEEKVEQKCCLFAITGMGGIGKTTLAQKIYNHPKIQAYFNLKVWVCVSQTYSEPELLKQIISGAKGNYGEANSKAAQLEVLRDSVASGVSLFLVLDDVWRSDVWVDLLRVPLYNANTSIRVLVTTRFENVAKEMEAAHIHPVERLSPESSWEVLRRRLFREGEEELVNGLKELGIKMVKRCGGLPLAIKAITGVLVGKERNRQVWERVLGNDAWSISKFPEELGGALYLSFEDLPTHLKQCFLYFSLYAEDTILFRQFFIRLWVAEGFVTQQEDSSMEDLAEEYFNELIERNLLLLDADGGLDASKMVGVVVTKDLATEDLTKDYFDLLSRGNFLLPVLHGGRDICKMHDLIRSLAIFLSKEEISFVDENVKNSTASTKLRRLSIAREREAAEILDSISDQGALRTLLASYSNLCLDDERLRRLSHLRVLDISSTSIDILPDSIGNLVHLRYLDLSFTNITTIPESIERLTYLQFLIIRDCEKLTQLPGGIIRLHNLRHLDLTETSISFIPKGIGKLQQLNFLFGFVVANTDSSSKLEELTSLKQIRVLRLELLERAQSGLKFLGELSYLSKLSLNFTTDTNILDKNVEEQLTVEKLLDELTLPSSLQNLTIDSFFGRRFPNWMALPTFERCVPLLTGLSLYRISSCTQLPPLGQLPELKYLFIYNVSKVKKIGPEFLGGGVNSTTNSSTRIAFPKLETLHITRMPELEEWCFGTQVEGNASPRLMLLPSLQNLILRYCPLLKQLPKGLEHSAMKSLDIEKADSMKSLDNLPPKIERLSITSCQNLEQACYLPSLKLDALQELEFIDNDMETLPGWLLMILQQRGLKNDNNDNFKLNLYCSVNALRGCIKGGSHWDIIQHIPKVIAKTNGENYLRYIKQPYVYDTNL